MLFQHILQTVVFAVSIFNIGDMIRSAREEISSKQNYYPQYIILYVGSRSKAVDCFANGLSLPLWCYTLTILTIFQMQHVWFIRYIIPGKCPRYYQTIIWLGTISNYTDCTSCSADILYPILNIQSYMSYSNIQPRFYEVNWPRVSCNTTSPFLYETRCHHTWILCIWNMRHLSINPLLGPNLGKLCPKFSRAAVSRISDNCILLEELSEISYLDTHIPIWCLAV